MGVMGLPCGYAVRLIDDWVGSCDNELEFKPIKELAAVNEIT